MSELKSVLIDFEQTIRKLIDESWNLPDIEQHFDSLAQNAAAIKDAMSTVGDFAFEKLESGVLDLTFFTYTFHFPENAKKFLILWRDLLFEQQKAEIFLLEKKTTQTQLDALRLQSKTAVENAATSLFEFINRTVEPSKNSRLDANEIEKYKAQRNPWPTYKSQLKTINDQCTLLRSNHKKMKDIIDIFDRIKSNISETSLLCSGDLTQWIGNAKNSIDFIDQTMTSEEEIIPKKIATTLETTANEIVVSDRLLALTSSIENLVQKLPAKMLVPVNTNGGIIQNKEINFQNATMQWLESEIIPLLYEVAEVTENSGNSIKMAFMNICNRCLLVSNGINEGKALDLQPTELRQPLVSFLKKVDPYIDHLSMMKELVGQRLQLDFNLSEVYNLKNVFLPIPLQSSIRQYQISKNKVMSSAQVWWLKQTKPIRTFLQKVEKEEQLTDSEKIVRYLQSQKHDTENNLYSNIFLTTGYIGESFWVGRKEELTHIENSIRNWENGYRGAVALVGERFCGKSLFGELALNRFSKTTTIRLQPNASLKFNGRVLETTMDLGKALEFIKKYSINSPVAVWIDDLEIWQNHEIPLHRNIRHLKKAIENNGGIFFLVAMNCWTKNHISILYDFESFFQSEINLSQMSLAEIREAILIRHGATHKTLIDIETKKEISSQMFFQATRQVFNESHGNIGEALSKWSRAIKKVDEEQVYFKKSERHQLPNFIDTETGILLSSILLSKQINEYRLRKNFGPIFNENFKNLVQRFLGIGLLQRQIDGKLQINELAVNEIGRMLSQKDLV